MQSTQGDPPFETAGKKCLNLQANICSCSYVVMPSFDEILPPIPPLNKASNVASVIIQPY